MDGRDIKAKVQKLQLRKRGGEKTVKFQGEGGDTKILHTPPLIYIFFFLRFDNQMRSFVCY